MNLLDHLNIVNGAVILPLVVGYAIAVLATIATSPGWRD